MNRYAVALHLTKPIEGGLKRTETVDLCIISANSAEEALGLRMCKKDADWTIGAFKAILIQDEKP